MDFNWNTVDAKRALKNSLNIAFNEYHLGYKLEHDTQKLKSLNAILALKNAKGDFFIRSDLLAKTVVFGCHHSHGPKAVHAIEALYDVEKKLVGIAGQPVSLIWSGQYKLSDDITFKTKFDVKKSVTLTASWIHQFSKNLRFVFTDNLDLTNAISEPAKTNYNFGALIEWTI